MIRALHLTETDGHVVKPVTFYEIKRGNDTLWGGSSASECVKFWRNSSGAGKSVWVSVWDEGDELDYKLINEPVNVTPLLFATLLDEMERKPR